MSQKHSIHKCGSLKATCVCLWMLTSLSESANRHEKRINSGSPRPVFMLKYNFRIFQKKQTLPYGCLSLCDAVFRCKPPCVVLCNFIHAATSWFTQDWYLASPFPLYQLVGVRAIVAGGLFYFCAHCRSAKSHDRLPVKPTGCFLLLGQIQSAWRAEWNPWAPTRRTHAVATKPALTDDRDILKRGQKDTARFDFNVQLTGSLTNDTSLMGPRVPALSIPARFCRHPAMPQWL